MTTRALLLTTILVSFTATSPLAQTAGRSGRAPVAVAPNVQTPPPPPPPPPPGGSRSRREGQPVNIKVEFTITDQRAGGPPIKRTVSVIVADAHTGLIRSQSEVIGVMGSIPLNVDTAPELLSDGKIRLGFNLQYDSPAPIDNAADRNLPRGTIIKTAMHDTVALILESGKSMVAAQSADPIGDRQVTVEVKATVLR